MIAGPNAQLLDLRRGAWLGRPDESLPAADIGEDVEAAQPLPYVVYRLAIRFIVAHSIIVIVTVLAVLSIMKLLEPRS